ncbi:MAG: YceI family protein [Chloroflexi bacterium]|nr:YceI family protein [Chloroflexota bacterium]
MTTRKVVLLLGLPVLAVLAVVGGWWFLIREDAQLATSPLDIPDDLASNTEPDGSDGAESGTDVLAYAIIGEMSEAAYFVGEELASLPLPSTARGATDEIEGFFFLTSDGAALAGDDVSKFTVDLTNLESGQSRRDSMVRRALETSQFPTTTFTFASVIGFDESIPDGEEQTLTLTGTLDLHGVQQEITWDVQAIREADVISALATTTFLFTDFDISPPNIAGFVSVSDEVTLQVQLIAQAG